ASAVWPGEELPRTEGTRKLKRRELRSWLLGQQSASPVGSTFRSGVPRVSHVLERFAPARTIEASTTIDELGLTSLERVELQMALEEAFQVTVDEGEFAGAKTVGDLENLVVQPVFAEAPGIRDLKVPATGTEPGPRTAD